MDHPSLNKLVRNLSVDPDAECWVWTAALHLTGYGVLRHEGRVSLAHRVAYELLVGPIPDGHDIDHLCRNRPCFNPDHLEPVLPAENTRRGMANSARTKRTGLCQRGHAMTADNVYVRPNGIGSRECRTCRQLRRANAA